MYGQLKRYRITSSDNARKPRMAGSLFSRDKEQGVGFYGAIMQPSGHLITWRLQRTEQVLTVRLRSFVLFHIVQCCFRRYTRFNLRLEL